MHVSWRWDKREVCLLSYLKSHFRQHCFSLRQLVLSQQKKTSCFRRSLSLHVFIGHKPGGMDGWMDGWMDFTWHIDLSQTKEGFQVEFKCWPSWLDKVSHTPTHSSPCDCPQGGSRMPLLRKCLWPKENRKSIISPIWRSPATYVWISRHRKWMGEWRSPHQLSKGPSWRCLTASFYWN